MYVCMYMYAYVLEQQRFGRPTEAKTCRLLQIPESVWLHQT